MIGKEVRGTRLSSLPEVLEILEERKKDGELGYEQQIEYEHAKKFVKLSTNEAEKMSKELVSAGLSERTALKCVEVMPLDINQLKLVLVIDKITLDEESLKKVLGIVNSYRSK